MPRGNKGEDLAGFAKSTQQVYLLNRGIIQMMVLTVAILALVGLAKLNSDKLRLDMASATPNNADTPPVLARTDESDSTENLESAEPEKSETSESCKAEQLPLQVGYYQIVSIGDDNIDGNLPARTDAGSEAELAMSLPHGTSNIYVTGACRSEADGTAWWEIDLDPGAAFVEASHLSPMSGQINVCPTNKPAPTGKNKRDLIAEIDGDDASDYIVFWKDTNGWTVQVEYGDGVVGTRSPAILQTFEQINTVGAVELDHIERDVILVSGSKADGSSSYIILESLETAAECGLRTLNRPNNGTAEAIEIATVRDNGIVNDLRCKKTGRGIRELNIWSAVWTASGWQTTDIPLLPSQVNGELITGEPRPRTLYGNKKSPPIPTYSRCI